MSDKEKVISVLSEIADLLEANGVKTDTYRIKAYRDAVYNLRKLGPSLQDIENFEAIPGVGKSIAEKIYEVVTTGGCAYLTELKMKCPPKSIAEFTAIRGIGPAGAKKIWETHKVSTLMELKTKLDDGTIKDDALKIGVAKAMTMMERIPLVDALETIKPLMIRLEEAFGAENVVMAGSIRRKKPTVHDADILVRCEDDKICAEIMEGLAGEFGGRFAERISNFVLQGPYGDFDAQVILVKQSEWGGALIHWTGPKEKNVRDRMLAGRKGMMLNDKGLWEISEAGYKQLDIAHTEKEIHDILGIHFMPPEMRDLAEEVDCDGAMGTMVKSDYVPRGDLHVHSKASDGEDAMETMIRQAELKYYKYIGFADHGNGLPMCQIKNFDIYLSAIHSLRSHYKHIEIFAGIEANIDKDGGLGYSDEDLKRLDYVIASIHSHLELSDIEQTNRLLKAIANPYVYAIGHPACDSWGTRGAIECDWERIFEAMAKRKVFWELNGDPARSGLDCNWLRRAKDVGVNFIFGSDAHSINGLEQIKNSVWLGSRFGLTFRNLFDRGPK